MDFYLTLPSNVSKDDKTNEFSIHLPRKINLDGNWEVALVEIQYPHSWNNIDGLMKSELKDNWIKIKFADNYSVNLIVPIGYYGSVQELIAGIEYGKKKLKKLFTAIVAPDLRNDLDNLIFRYNETLKRVIFKRNGSIRGVEFSEKLQYMMGFERPYVYDIKEIAKYMPDMKIGFYSLYVYCDLVEPQIVGNVTAPLLRNVHIEGRHGDIVEKLFNAPHYVPVIAKEIDRVKIEIKDDTYQFVPFDFGKVVLKLHFRKKRVLL